MTFNEIKTQIEICPISYLPALLLIIIETCVRKRVFRDRDAMMRVIMEKMENPL